MSIVIDVADPTLLISGNRGLHHHRRAEVRRYWRELAGTLARRDRIGRQLDPVRIVITVRYPDKRRRDVGNLYEYVAKPCVDGLVDAGVLPDDDDLHLQGPDLRRDPERGPHRLVISILPCEPDALAKLRLPGRDDA